MKNEFKTLNIEVYKCPECEQEIYSRAQHDFISCDCGRTSLDGGHLNDDTWIPERLIGLAIEAKRRILTLDITSRHLYDDWNNSIDDFGKVK